MENQIPHYSDTNTAFQDHSRHNQPPPTSVPESRAVRGYSQAPSQYHANRSFTQAEMVGHPAQHQRAVSDPSIYPYSPYMPPNNQLVPPQRQRSLSTGADPCYLGGPTVVNELPPAVVNNNQPIPQPDVYDFSWIGNESFDPAEITLQVQSGWPVDVPSLGQYQAFPDQPFPFDALLQEGETCPQQQGAPENAQAPYSLADVHTYPSAQRPGNPSKIQHREGPARSNQQKTAYMRRVAPHPYANGLATRNQPKGSQSGTRLPSADRSHPAASLPTAQQPYPEPARQAHPSSQQTIHQTAKEKDPLMQNHGGPSASRSYRQRSSHPQPRYKSVGVQTDPVIPQPAGRYMAGKANNRAGAPERAAERGKSSVPEIPKAIQQSRPVAPAQVPPKLIPLAPRPPAPTRRPRPTVDTSIARPAGIRSPSCLSQQNQAHARPSNVIRPNSQTPNVLTSSASTARAYPMQKQQGLFSPYTPGSAMHHVFNEGQPSQEPGLITQKLSLASWQIEPPNVSASNRSSNSGPRAPPKPLVNPVTSLNGSKSCAQNIPNEANTQRDTESRADYQGPNQNSLQSAEYCVPHDRWTSQKSLRGGEMEIDKPPCITISKPDTFEKGKSQMVSAEHTDITQFKRKRSDSPLELNRRTRRQEGESSLRVPQNVPEGSLKPPTPKVARSNTKPFDFNAWLVPEAPQNTQAASNPVKVEVGCQGSGRGREPVGDAQDHLQQIDGCNLVNTSALHPRTRDLVQTAAVFSNSPTCPGGSSFPTHGPQSAEHTFHSMPQCSATKVEGWGESTDQGARPAHATSGRDELNVCWALQLKPAALAVHPGALGGLPSLKGAYGLETQSVTHGAGYLEGHSGVSEARQIQEAFKDDSNATATPASGRVTGCPDSLLSDPYLNVLTNAQDQIPTLYGYGDFEGLFEGNNAQGLA